MILVWAGLALAALALIVVLASAGRVRRFLELREEVQTRLEDLAKVVAPASVETQAVLDEAKQVFHEIGMRMAGFARGIAKPALRGMGYDASAASSGLIGLSNALPVYGIERLRWRAQVERALKIENGAADARRKRPRLDPVLAVLAVAALAFAAWTYAANRNLDRDLQAAHAARAALEKDNAGARDRAAEAEQATRAVEASMAEVRGELAATRKAHAASERALADIAAQLTLTQKAKAAADQSVENLRGELSAAERARKAAEDRAKEFGDEAAALTAAKAAAERSLKAATDELAQLRAAKEAADAAAAKAVEDLARERQARDAPGPAAP